MKKSASVAPSILSLSIALMTIGFICNIEAVYARKCNGSLSSNCLLAQVNNQRSMMPKFCRLTSTRGKLAYYREGDDGWISSIEVPNSKLLSENYPITAKVTVRSNLGQGEYQLSFAKPIFNWINVKSKSLVVKELSITESTQPEPNWQSKQVVLYPPGNTTTYNVNVRFKAKDEGGFYPGEYTSKAQVTCMPKV